MANVTRPSLPRRVLTLGKRFGIFAGLWLVMSGAAVDGLGFGLAATLAATWLSLVLLPPGTRRVSLLAMLPLFPGFVDRSIRGGVDVAARALHRHPPIRPGWYLHETKLPPGGARVALGSVVSLLPGTLVAGSFGDRLYVHCLVADEENVRAVEAEERRIAGTLGDEAGR
jgi:multicomponent Na+:H+ antiporter subunit E